MILQAIPALMQALRDFLPEPDEKAAVRKSRKVALKPLTWKDVYGMAARAGVDPRPFSIRELRWMVDAKGRDEWDRIAWLCMHIPSFRKGTRRFSAFHPILKAENAVDIRELQEWAEDVSKLMPETISEEEDKRKYEAWCRKQDQDSVRK